MAGNFRGTKFSWLSSGKHFAKKNSRFRYPQLQFIRFIVRLRGMGFEIESMVRGYHCYNAIWDATIGEELLCTLELSNPEDRFAVAVVRGEVTVGHVPKRISLICS